MGCVHRESGITREMIEEALPADGRWVDNGDDDVTQQIARTMGRKQRHGAAVHEQLLKLEHLKRVELRIRPAGSSNTRRTRIITGARRLVPQD